MTDTSGTSLENVEIGLIGHDTLFTNAQGELVFTELVETNSILYKTTLDGYKSIKSVTAVLKNDTVFLSLKPLSVFFEIKDKNNADLKDVNITLGQYGTTKTDSRGIAGFSHISKSEKIDYSIDGLGFYKLVDSLGIQNADLTILRKLDPIHFWFKVIDINTNPIAAAAVILDGKLKWTNVEGVAEFTQIPSEGDLVYSVMQNGFNEANGTVNLAIDKDTIIVILNVKTYSVNFSITDENNNAIRDAAVSLSGYGVFLSDENGTAVFENVEPKDNIIYSVSKSGYRDTINVFNLIDADVFISIALKQSSGTGIYSGMPTPVTLYPSPASDFVNINFTDQKGKLLIYNMKSSLVYSGQISSNFTKLDINNWENGLYVLKIQNNDGDVEIYGKLMVQR